MASKKSERFLQSVIHILGLTQRLLVVSDTYVDFSKVQHYMIHRKKVTQGPIAVTGCLFEDNGVIPWPFPYGGFSTVLEKEVLEELVQPIYCNGFDDPIMSNSCASIVSNRIGERVIFEEGMSAFDLFYHYTAIEDFCFHSDWLIGYMIKYYSSSNEGGGLDGMKNFPFCGNFTGVNHDIINDCSVQDSVCHKQKPPDMESLALSSWVKRPERFKSIPILTKTSVDVATDVILQKEKAYEDYQHDLSKILLPNLMLIGTQETSTSVSIASNYSVAAYIFHLQIFIN